MISILLVEDEAVALNLLTAILAKGYPRTAIYPALNGRAGLELFKEHLPDIVITDISMPEMNGRQMVEKICLIKPETRIIVLTAGVGASDPQPATWGAGIDHVILKPVNFQALFGAIEACLDEIARRGEPHASTELSSLLDALEGDRQALNGLIGDFLASYRGHLDRMSGAISAGNARHLEKSAHQFKGSLGIFCRSEPLALTERLLEMGERQALTQAPHTLELLEQEMELLAANLREASCLTK